VLGHGIAAAASTTQVRLLPVRQVEPGPLLLSVTVHCVASHTFGFVINGALTHKFTTKVHLVCDAEF